MLREETIFCQPSWVMESATVRMAVTCLGAHMAPVQFCRRGRDFVDPYYVTPWQCEENAVLGGQSEKVLRGDFFCLPFGYAEPKLKRPSHGRTAGGAWSLDGSQSKDGVHELRISMKDALVATNVTRRYYLRDGEDVIYDRTTITGLSGAYTVGHHAVLRVPSSQTHLLVSTSRQIFGMTYPKPFDDLDVASLQSLAIGAEFEDLRRVPLASNHDVMVDLSIHPSSRASANLLQVAVKAEKGQPAWTAAVNTEEGYLWFSLRDAAVLPSTLVWVENRARRLPPWNGRSCLLGLEDVCSFFNIGSEISRKENAFSARGIKTVREFSADQPSNISYIQGAARTPDGFGRVCAAECDHNSSTFTDVSGKTVRVSLDSGFVFGKEL